MSSTKIANRYAQAFFDLAQENPAFEVIAAEVKELQATALNSPELRDFFQDPVLTQETKKKIIREMFDKKLHVFVLNFLLFLVEKRRLNFIFDIFKIFNQLYLKHKNVAD